MEKADAFLDRLLKMPAFMKAEEFKTNGDQKFVLKVIIFYFIFVQKKKSLAKIFLSYFF